MGTGEGWREPTQLSSAHYALLLRNFPGIILMNAVAQLLSIVLGSDGRGGHVPAGRTVCTGGPHLAATQEQSVWREGGMEVNEALD